ncbi:MAG: TRAP transporter small permease subunit [Rhizobiaceae bacterium]
MKSDQTTDIGGGANTPPPEFPSSALTRLIGKLAFFASIISAALVVLTLLVTAFSVFRRYVLGKPLTWSDELSGFLVVAIVMLGAAEVLRKNEHISVDILTGNMTGTKKWLVELWSNISVAIVAGVICVSGYNAVQFSLKIGVYSDGYLEAPLWIPQSFLLAGAGLLLLLSLARVADLLFFKRGR